MLTWQAMWNFPGGFECFFLPPSQHVFRVSKVPTDSKNVAQKGGTIPEHEPLSWTGPTLA